MPKPPPDAEPLDDSVDCDLEAAARNCPSNWFSALETALARGDFEAARDADRELRRLGVRVRFPMIRDCRCEGRE